MAAIKRRAVMHPAAKAKATAMASAGPEGSLGALERRAITLGKTAPARLPQMLIPTIAVASPLFCRTRLGTAQNAPCATPRPSPAKNRKYSAAIPATGATVMTIAAAATRQGPMTNAHRMPVRSDRSAPDRIPTNYPTQGIALISPNANGSRPVSDCATWGNQKASP